jgi:hypothetical protein
LIQRKKNLEARISCGMWVESILVWQEGKEKYKEQANRPLCRYIKGAMSDKILIKHCDIFETCDTSCYKEPNPYLKIAKQILRQELIKSLVLKSKFKFKFGHKGIK